MTDSPATGGRLVPSETGFVVSEGEQIGEPVQLRRFGRAIDVAVDGSLTDVVEDCKVVETAFRLWARLPTPG